MPEINYSIIIPTFNRAEILKKCLLNIVNLQKPKSDYEVIVIDNHSTDITKEIVSSFNEKISNLIYVFEERQGLHYCRNRALSIARGNILCYIDDDSFINQNWLIAIERIFNNGDILIATGPCFPEYEKGSSDFVEKLWNKSNYGKYIGFLSLMDFGNDDKFIDAGFVYGCNFIIRKKPLEDLQGFHPDGFPKEKLYLRGDGENYVSFFLARQGIKAFYSKDLWIKHFVPSARMTVDYFCKRAFNEGISSSYIDFRYGIEQIIEGSKSVYNNNTSYFNKLLSVFIKIISKIIRICSQPYQKTLMKYKIKKSFIEGYNHHRNLLQSDIELQKWVLKKNYLN